MTPERWTVLALMYLEATRLERVEICEMLSGAGVCSLLDAVADLQGKNK